MRISARLSLLLLAALLLLPSPAHAAHFSGAYLLQLCGIDKSGHELVKGGHTACEAYIDGVLDYHSVLQSMHIAPSVDICVPKNVSSADLHAIVLNYLSRNSENDAFIAAPAVTMALYEVYPCNTAATGSVNPSLTRSRLIIFGPYPQVYPR